MLLFDTFFKEKIKYIYIFFLFYIFLISFYYTSVIFPLLLIYQVFLGVLSFFMVLFVFFFPFIRYFSSFLSLSRNIGIYIGYSVSSFTIFSIFFETLSFFYGCILIISLLFHATVYKKYKNYPSYGIFFLTLIFLSIKIFFLSEQHSFLSHLLFLFLLPYMFIGVGYTLYNRYMREIYILYFLAIGYNIFSFVYYFLKIGSLSDILTLSVLMFFESILLFISYLRFKK